MADILIKGMELPKDDILRIEICPDGQVNRIIGWALSEPKRGKAVALPEHGDLIDRKVLSDAIGKVITDRDRMIGTYDTIEQIIDEAETIVEATE